MAFPLLDTVHFFPLEVVDNRLSYGQSILNSLEPGIHYILLHPVQDTPEIRDMATDWPARVDDYQLFLNPKWQEAVAQSGVEVIGYRPLRDAMRG